MPLNLFSVGHLLLGMQITLKEQFVSPVRFPWGKKTNFHFKVVIHWRLLVVAQEWGHVFTFFSALGPNLVQTSAGPVHAASVSVSSYVCRHCQFTGSCFFNVPYLLCLFLSPLCLYLHHCLPLCPTTLSSLFHLNLFFSIFSLKCNFTSVKTKSLYWKLFVFNLMLTKQPTSQVIRKCFCWNVTG